MGDACKLHIGNLSYEATEDEIRECFEKFGTVDEGLLK